MHPPRSEDPTPGHHRPRLPGWLAAAGFPVLFVFVWSSGFLVGDIGTREASPGALGFWRFAVATVVLAVVAVATRAPWPRRPVVWLHLMITGVLLQACQFAGAFLAMDLGLSAGVTSLITDATPLVVAAAAVPLFGERLGVWQVIGLVLGFCGVAAAVSADISGLGTVAGIVAAIGGLAGSAGGTLYQKRFGADMDLRTGMCVQLAAATMATVPLAAFTGGFAVPATVTAVGSVLWLALVGSIGAFVLLFVLLRHRPGASATSHLFLVPPATALAAVPLLDQHLTWGAITGFALAATGVALVTRARGPAARVTPEESMASAPFTTR